MRQVRRLVTRPATAALILFGVYLVLGLIKEPRAHMATDTGMRAATIRVMDENGGITSLSQSELGARLGRRVQHSPPGAE